MYLGTLLSSVPHVTMVSLLGPSCQFVFHLPVHIGYIIVQDALKDPIIVTKLFQHWVNPAGSLFVLKHIGGPASPRATAPSHQSGIHSSSKFEKAFSLSFSSPTSVIQSKLESSSRKSRDCGGVGCGVCLSPPSALRWPYD